MVNFYLLLDGLERAGRLRAESGLEATNMIKLKRVYEKDEPEDGVRYLIERLWPRGVKKTALRIDGWLK